jgi:hypothetical protein
VVANPITGKSTVYLYKRGGYTAVASLTGVGTPGIGIIVWTGNTSSNAMPVASFVNNPSTSTSVWDITSTGTKLGGDIASTNQCIALTETVISGTANLVGYFTDSGTGVVEQWYYPESGAWTQTTDSDFPTNAVGAPAHMDGYVFNMTRDGRIYNSDLNSVSAYSANSYITANDYPDKGVSVARMGNYILGFGETSIEFFINAGNATGSPLKRVNTLRIGAVRRFGLPTVTPAFGNIYWVGSSPELAATGIYRFKGMEPDKISNPAIDKLISDGEVIGIVGAMMLHGMRHIALSGSAGDRMWCYCIDTGFWWSLKTAGSGITACCPYGIGITTPNAQTIFTGNASELYGRFGTDIHQDNGSAFTMTVQTENMDCGTDRMKFWDRIRISYDRQSAASNLGISWSDDDHANYSTALNIDTSTEQSWLTALGASRRRSWKFTHSANTACRIHAVEVDYSPEPTA